MSAIEDAFPKVDPGVIPLGSRVLVQIRAAEEKSKGGIILSASDRDTQTWNTQVAKVISLGQLAFHNRNTAELWPEGAWCKVGDFVRVAKYGGDRFETTSPDGAKGLFVIYNDLDIIGIVTVDPTTVKAFF